MEQSGQCDTQIHEVTDNLKEKTSTDTVEIGHCSDSDDDQRKEIGTKEQSDRGDTQTLKHGQVVEYLHKHSGIPVSVKI